MSLEAAILENTKTMRELIAALVAGLKAPLAAAKDEPVAKASPAKAEPVAEAESAAKAKAVEAEPEDKKVLDYKDVSAAVIALVTAKGKPAAMAMLAEFGVTKAPSLGPEQFEAVIARAAELAEA